MRFVAVRSSKPKTAPVPPLAESSLFGSHDTSFLFLLVPASKPTTFSTNLSKMMMEQTFDIWLPCRGSLASSPHMQWKGKEMTKVLRKENHEFVDL
jgi:hypothetical protein